VKLLARLTGAIYYSPERGRMIALSDEAIELAEELDDPEARTYACAARRRALSGARHLQARLGASTEMLTRARQAGSLELELQSHAWLTVDLLEYGDRDAVDAQIEAFCAGADRLRQPLFTWNAMVWRAMQALMAGDLRRAEELAADAMAAGAPAEAVAAREYHAMQLLAIRREQGLMAGLEAAARRLVDTNPDRAGWRAALATLLWEAGRVAEAQAEIDVLAARGFEDITHDGDWMPTVVLIGDLCAELGDTGPARLLYEQLLPYTDHNVVVGLAAVCLGSVATFVGKLAATIGNERGAAAHFEHALDANAALRAPVCLAHTQLDYARALGPGPRAEELIESAANTAQALGLQKLARRAADLACGERGERGLPRTLPSPGS